MSTPLDHQTKLLIIQAPNFEKGRREVKTIPYANRVGSIMYGMMCSKLDMMYVVSMISTLMVNNGHAH